MSTTTIGLVGAILRQQAEIFDGTSISLDSLWRAAGCPAGRDPRSWAQLAAPLVAGFVGYRANLARNRQPPADHPPVLWDWDGDDSDPWWNGDLMSTYHVAQVYAAYLDAKEVS